MPADGLALDRSSSRGLGRVRDAWAHFLTWIPAGGSLPDASWRDRHRAIVWLLWAHAVGIAIFGLLMGYGIPHSFAEGMMVALPAFVAGRPEVRRQVRAGVATFGLVLSSALLVHVSGGYVEFHFHFFVMVIVVSLYEDWVPFLLAVLWVVLEHGVVGVIAPEAVYNHPDALAHPWKWAAIHGAFVVAASVASIAAWRLNELVRGRYRLILDAAGDGIYGVDRRGRITFVNAAAERILGRRPVDLVGRHEGAALRFAAAPGPTDDAPYPAQAALASGAAHSGSGVELRRPDGESFFLDYVATPVRERAEVVGAVVTFQDVTERVRSEQALRESEARLRQSQKMEAIGLLAGGVAHDFNNLMTVVTGFSDLVLARLPATDPTRGFVEQIASAGTRASALTDQLLAFSRKQVLKPELLDLNEAVASTQKMLGRVIGEDVELELSLNPAIGRVRADRGQIGQVVLNLAVNARDAMPGGGKLSIVTRAAADAQVVLEVSDTGTGMDEATQRRIFEPFFTTKEQGKGTGLGLSTVYGIVAQSGGRIEVESALGRGTTFRIYLPRFEAVAAPSDADGPAEAPVGRETVLLVEDEAAVRRLVHQLLQARGYTVLEAAGGEHALSVAREHAGQIDLLLTDVVMPGMSGPDLAERLRAVRPEARVLYMSGYTDHPAVRQAAGPDGHFLQKPFTPDALGRAVRQRIDAPRPAQALAAAAGVPAG